MSQTAAPAAETKSPLDAAQKIVAELQGMTPENQSLALQFAVQTLRLTPATVHSAPSMPPAHSHVPNAHAPVASSGQPTDIKSFTAAKAPKSDQQFAAVAAYFYQFEAPENERREAIDPDLLKSAGRLSGYGQAADWRTTLNNAMRSGYFNRAGRGEFALSSVGENLVAITLGGNGANSGAGGGGAGRKASPKKGMTKKTTKKGG